MFQNAYNTWSLTNKNLQNHLDVNFENSRLYNKDTVKYSKMVTYSYNLCGRYIHGLNI